MVLLQGGLIRQTSPHVSIVHMFSLLMVIVEINYIVRMYVGVEALPACSVGLMNLHGGRYLPYC